MRAGDPGWEGLRYGKAPPPGKRVRAATTRHRRERKAKRAAETDVKAAVRKEVFRLDPNCVVCGAPPSPDDEMHEVIPRSKTRGRPPAERFNRRICCRLCKDDHGRVTAHGIELAFLDPALGMDGGLVYQYQLRGEPNRYAWVYRRGQAAGYGRTPGYMEMCLGRVAKGLWWPEEEEMGEVKTKPAVSTKKPMTPERKPAAGPKR